MGREPTGPIAEIDLCRAWTRLPRSIPLTTTDGRSVDVIHLGTWTYGFGPDFRDAIISIDDGPTDDTPTLLDLFDQPYRAVGTATTYTCCAFIGHEYNELTKK